jgi:hypothetical protein
MTLVELLRHEAGVAVITTVALWLIQYPQHSGPLIVSARAPFVDPGLSASAPLGPARKYRDALLYSVEVPDLRENPLTILLSTFYKQIL